MQVSIVLRDFFFSGAARADVLNCGKGRFASGEENSLGCDFDVEDLAVLSAMAPVPAESQSRRVLADGFENAWNVFDRTYVGDTHAQEFLARVSILCEGCRVNVEKRQCFRVVNVHRLGIGGKQKLRIRASERVARSGVGVRARGAALASAFRRAQGRLLVWPQLDCFARHISVLGNSGCPVLPMLESSWL